MYIPDLFSAYIKGREMAIQKNWQDLRNYEAVENARLANDHNALDLLAKRADFAGNRSIAQNQVDNSARANEVSEHAQSGIVARADLGSMFAQDQRSVYDNNRPTTQQVLNDVFVAQLGKQGVASGILNSQNEYWNPQRQYDTGQRTGQIAYDTITGNSITASNYPSVARQQVLLSDGNFVNTQKGQNLQGMQIDSAVAQQPLIHKNAVDGLQRVIPSRQAMQDQIANASGADNTTQELAGLYALAYGNPQIGAIYQLEQMGKVPQGTFAGMVSNLTNANAQQPQQQLAIPTTVNPDLLSNVPKSQPYNQPATIVPQGIQPTSIVGSGVNSPVAGRSLLPTTGRVASKAVGASSKAKALAKAFH